MTRFRPVPAGTGAQARPYEPPVTRQIIRVSSEIRRGRLADPPNEFQTDY
ncbi:MAG: hypothetical protein ACK40V_09840 [Anaerolineales bacterium]